MVLPPTMCSGDPNANLLVVGMAPGRDEMESGTPFVGASGKLLWSCAARSGFSRADCYILNTIGEPPANAGGPTAEEYEKYWDAFQLGLNRFTGRSILLLGGDALFRTTGINNRISDWRGYLLNSSHLQSIMRNCQSPRIAKRSGKLHQKGDTYYVTKRIPEKLTVPDSVQWIIPTLHPAAVIRTGFKTTAVLAYDIDRAWRAATDRLNLFTPTIRKDNIISGSAYFIKAGTPLAIDIETGRSLVGDSFITHVGLANEEKAWSFPWTPLVRELVNDALSRASVIVGHNLSFDIPRLEANRVVFPKKNLFDTMLACQLLQPDLLKGLNWVSSMYLDTYRWKHLADSDIEFYNAMDVAGTLELYRTVEPALRASNQYDLFINNIMASLPVLMNMHIRGIKVDPKRKEEWKASLEEQEKRMLELWKAHHPGVSPNSPTQLKNLFYGVLKYPTQIEEGRVTTNQNALMRLYAKTSDTSISILIAYKKITKMRNSFAMTPVGFDGRIHPVYLPSSKDMDDESKKEIAGTGRIQARDPNIMQQPQEARKIYIPQSPRARFVEFDYNQAELRVVAALSGDADLLGLLDSTDVHAVHAERWGCARKDAKIITFATLYGARERKLQLVFQRQGVSKSQEECRQLQNKFFSDHPLVREWQAKITSLVLAEGLLRNPFGRVRYFHDAAKDIPAALDFLPQSTVADVGWSIYPDLDRELTSIGGHLTTIVHDSFLIELPQDLITVNTVGRIRKILSRKLDNIAPGFSLPVSVKVGDNWGMVSAEDFDLDIENGGD